MLRLLQVLRVLLGRDGLLFLLQRSDRPAWVIPGPLPKAAAREAGIGDLPTVR